MKKTKNSILAILLVTVMSFTLMTTTACKDDKVYYNNENDPLVFSSAEVDKVFNPFFSTNAADSSVVGMTQIGMLTNDKDGKPVCGEEYPTVAEKLVITDNGKEEDNGLQTTYYFVLKNDVKFSDGSPLTIKDVLFNLYVYLDPVYTGSSTIYSTDIVGLEAYRSNTRDENEQDSFRDQFEIKAESRIDALLDTVSEAKDRISDGMVDNVYDGMVEYVAEMAGKPAYAHVMDDYTKATELFKEELATDYSNSMDSYSEMKFYDENKKVYENMFTTDVEVFLYNEGYITWNRKEAKMYCSAKNDYKEVRSWTKEQAIEWVYNDKIPSAIDEVVSFWATASTLHEYIVNDEMSDYFDSATGGVSSIEGIKFANRKGSVTVDGKTYEIPTYNKDGSVKSGNEVLSITINNVDPKAIWNFSFGVAPMFYYSSEEEIAKFDFESHFGVKKGNQDFMQKVVKRPDRLGVPVGAGAYAASKASGGITDIEAGDFYSKGVIYFERNPHFLLGKPKIKKIRYQVVSSTQMLNSLYNGEIDFAEPNAKPETEAELNGKKDVGIENKSIRTMGYGYIGVNAGKIPYIKVRQAIMHSINTQLCVDYYKTSAQPIYRPMSLESWAYPKGATSYYPYVGAPIPADLSKVNPDYKEFVESKNLSAGQKMTLDQQKEFIKKLVEDAGFTVGGDGVYSIQTGGGHSLKYTFTIAGEETDHPAWDAMYQAAQFLNTIGFQIIVKTDAQALSKLADGALTVWAAAWGSTIDPDMYQVYHMESKATSTLNWGYKQIVANNGGRYSTELELVEELSEIIDKARKVEGQTQRSRYYKQALDLVMELAVELPTYQRNDLYAYNANKIDKSSLTPDSGLSAFFGLTTNIHNVSLVVEK